MSVAGAWKVVSQFLGWSAWADAPAKNVIAAQAFRNLALAGTLAFARKFLIALIVSQFLAVVPTRITNNAGTGIPTVSSWFKPYSFSLRKKGADETVRHFCAQARMCLWRQPRQPRIAYIEPTAAFPRRARAERRNSGEIGREKRRIGFFGADLVRSRP
ncbi:hypothetical protein, partial [Mesorhizobium sp. M7A.F.Ca.CA.001.11.2.1]|uniref:hypothetical protein n=2 Tax=unclassified Mesorhizobium TaxID=325217 RepID=UPI001FDF4E0B